MRAHVCQRRDPLRMPSLSVLRIATGIAVAIIPVITGLGTRMKTVFTSIQTALR